MCHTACWLLHLCNVLLMHLVQVLHHRLQRIKVWEHQYHQNKLNNCNSCTVSGYFAMTGDRSAHHVSLRHSGPEITRGDNKYRQLPLNADLTLQVGEQSVSVLMYETLSSNLHHQRTIKYKGAKH